ncbi:tetratricopeptide repeat protein [Nitrosococcus watsonii]|uniref:Tetratricopeptide TPR_2 repeat protein n=1 Tax=Nitrosococcus watsoni (strain C-113) TaxID=105559 RepID=D8KA03_NITWC|nr:tetratricopeptide repeat protein [Nitrosococcus watsonii]ADJ29361.1 Tetratricopeptide TPR_2 repeat protein [Nitrosococcus watsonii C-113]
MKQAPFRLTAGLVVLLLAGCATQEMRPAAAAKAEENTTGPAVATTPETSYPDVELTPALLYQLLSADIAGQRGQVDYAMKVYLQLAGETRDPRLAERATRIALFARDISAATQAARLWVRADPNNEDARQALVSLLLGQQQYNEVETHLEHLVALSPESSERTFLKIATMLAGSADPETALALMGNLSAFQANDPDALYGYAYLALQLKRLDLALSTIERVIIQRPEADRPLIMRARILQQQGREDAALQSLETVIEKGEASIPLRLVYGQMLMEAGQVAKAELLFEQLEQAQPENPDVLLAQGLLAMERLEYEQAEDYFQRLLTLGQNVDQARFYLGRLAELQNNAAKAINWYASITGGRLMVDAQVRQAVVTAQRGNLPAARQHLQLLSKKFPTQADRFQLAEGEILINAGRYKEAMSHYDKALQSRPDDTNLLYARALVAENLGRLDIAEQDLRRVITLEPGNAEALNALGYTLADRTGRLEEALRYISRAMKLKPNNAFILDSMGWVYYRLGDYDKAEKYLREAMELRKDPEIAAHLGEVLWAKGDKAGARQVWQHTLKMNQGNKVLLEVMQRFQE